MDVPFDGFFEFTDLLWLARCLVDSLESCMQDFEIGSSFRTAGAEFSKADTPGGEGLVREGRLCHDQQLDEVIAHLLDPPPVFWIPLGALA